MKLHASPLLLKRTFVSALLVILAAGAALSQTNKASQKELPRGHYFVSCRPYMGDGYKSLPALVTGVTSNTDDGIQVEKVEVTNNSGRTIERLKFSWYVSTQENPETILLQGQTKLLGMPGGIKAGESVEILYPVISFADAIKSWSTQGITLKGMYVLQIAVSEVKFADKSTQVLLTHKTE